MNKYIESIIKSIDEEHVHRSEELSEVILRCSLKGKQSFHHEGRRVKAYVEKLGKSCHVLDVDGERFGVFPEYYEVVQ